MVGFFSAYNVITCKPNSSTEHNSTSKYLPARPGVPVVREVGADPGVYLAEGHPSLRLAVDGEGDESGVGVGRLSVLVAVGLCLHGIEAGRQVDGGGRGLADGGTHSCPVGIQVSVHRLVLPVSNAQSRQPIHSSETFIQTCSSLKVHYLVHTQSVSICPF